jgi:hypothetical protein
MRHIALKPAVAGALLAAAYAIAGLSASAQDATKSPTTSTTTTTKTTTTTTKNVKVPRTTATPEMIDEAVRRSKARHEKFLSTGKPEQWGSEEPFTK